MNHLNNKKILQKLLNFNYGDLYSETSNDGNRNYVTPDNNKYPSITTILKPLSASFLKKWRERVGEKEANKISHAAAWRGTQVHNALEYYLKNYEPYKITHPLIADGFNKIKCVINDHIDLIYDMEKALYCDYLKIAGRCDLLGRWDNQRAIIDFKTSANIKKKEWIESYFLQTCFYAIAIEERTKIPFKKLVIIIANDEQSKAQIFIGDRDDYAKRLLEVVGDYYNNETNV